MRTWNYITKVKAATILQRFRRNHTKDMRERMQARRNALVCFLGPQIQLNTIHMHLDSDPYHDFCRRR